MITVIWLFAVISLECACQHNSTHAHTCYCIFQVTCLICMEVNVFQGLDIHSISVIKYHKDHNLPIGAGSRFHYHCYCVARCCMMCPFTVNVLLNMWDVITALHPDMAHRLNELLPGFSALPPLIPPLSIAHARLSRLGEWYSVLWDISVTQAPSSEWTYCGNRCIMPLATLQTHPSATTITL